LVIRLSSIYSTDIVIIGGGVAGLWLLNRLCNRGYNAIVLEHKALGSGQTLASQGMIHGGIKYTLGGALTGASEAIADMPDHWRACLKGVGDVDLTQARVLSDHFYLWSSASLSSRLGGFLASKVTRGRVEKVGRDALPPIFADGNFRGSLYRLVDLVLDTPSVVRALAANYADRIFSLDWSTSRWLDGGEGVKRLELVRPEGSLVLDARAFILTAGEGNGALLAACGATAPRMQLRPLRQVMVKHNYPHTFFGHCVTVDKTPRLTISSHPMADGSQVWYLGGALAEKGANQRPEEVIATAQSELAALMPWVDLKEARWATLAVARAEPRQPNLVRPDKAFAAWATPTANVMAAWPTKLTLSPNLASEVENLLSARAIAPTGTPCPTLGLARPSVALTPWEEAFS